MKTVLWNASLTSVACASNELAHIVFEGTPSWRGVTIFVVMAIVAFIGSGIADIWGGEKRA